MKYQPFFVAPTQEQCQMGWLLVPAIVSLLVCHVKKVSMEEAQLTHGTHVLYARQGMHPDSMKSQSRESPPAEVPSCQMPKITSYRLKRELECRERWPMYALYAEDSTF